MTSTMMQDTGSDVSKVIITVDSIFGHTNYQTGV